MKIAVTYDNGNVFQHFGHTESFKVYDAANSAVTASTIISTNGSGHGALADVLKKCSVDTLICGGIGAGAKRALAAAGVTLYAGVSGSADQSVNDLLSGSLNYDSDLECDHHGEHHDDDCADHGCNCSDSDCDCSN